MLEEIFQKIEDGDGDALEIALRERPGLIHEKSQEGDQLLHIVCWQKQIQMLGILANYDPQVNEPGDLGRTPLHYAVHEGGALSISIVEWLIQRGADISIRDSEGYSPEDWAKVEIHDRLPEVLKLLRAERP